ncbi:hypothetical protein ACTMTI_42920 [Nonomuraea sp. H19]|uniref:hypothetical protein n=1 Tax=Nonomuraea sp. H19 TaxID=3452206 RepID=UPI003F8B3595
MGIKVAPIALWRRPMCLLAVAERTASGDRTNPLITLGCGLTLAFSMFDPGRLLDVAPVWWQVGASRLLFSDGG